ncbi:MAG: hypothetical protein J2O39_02435, partial [Acidimicrobiales bacterium]|nr:hypothetical protein [Acidimicrobiales bacterium]
ALGLPLEGHVVGAGELTDPEGRFPDAFGISGSGASLVRPDGVVAWRATDTTGASESAMARVLSSLLFREGRPER